MSDVANALMQGTVQRVTFRSQITPDYVYDPWSTVPTAPPSAGQAWLMNFIRPSVQVDTLAGPLVFEPYGPPTADYGLLVAAGGVATLVGAVFMIGWIARFTKKSNPRRRR